MPFRCSIIPITFFCLRLFLILFIVLYVLFSTHSLYLQWYRGCLQNNVLYCHVVVISVYFNLSGDARALWVARLRIKSNEKYILEYCVGKIVLGERNQIMSSQKTPRNRENNRDGKDIKPYERVSFARFFCQFFSTTLPISQTRETRVLLTIRFKKIINWILHFMFCVNRACFTIWSPLKSDYLLLR